MGVFSKMDLEKNISDNDIESPSKKFRTSIANKANEQKAYEKYAKTYKKNIRRSMEPKSSRDRDD